MLRNPKVADRLSVHLAGRAAIESGDPLFVRSFDGIVPASAGARDRARRMDDHALWIYVTAKASHGVR